MVLEDFQHHLKYFYSHLFPSDLMYKWMSYGNTESIDGEERQMFNNREWSFTIKDDIYTRYRSFATGDELKAELISQCPSKIDIGAIFTCPPKDHNSVRAGSFMPKERELVFDVDMNDYTRTCCQGANICPKCWPYMTVAVKVMDQVLRKDFGFKHMLWVFSGRRGVHCWVADRRARLLSNDAREALISYVAVYTGNENNKGFSAGIRAPLHPFMERAYEILDKYFDKIVLTDQEMFRGADGTERLLALVKFEDVAAKLAAKWLVDGKDTGLSSRAKWEALHAELGSKTEKERNNTIHQIVFSFLYPRLDVNVSKHQNHLLKSPFCIHPSTGNVCVAFEAENVDQFSPFNPAMVPKVNELASQIAEYERINGPSPSVPMYKKTNMKNSIEMLERFITKLLHEVKMKKIEENKAQSAEW